MAQYRKDIITEKKRDKIGVNQGSGSCCCDWNDSRISLLNFHFMKNKYDALLFFLLVNVISP